MVTGPGARDLVSLLANLSQRGRKGGGEYAVWKFLARIKMFHHGGRSLGTRAYALMEMYPFSFRPACANAGKERWFAAPQR